MKNKSAVTSTKKSVKKMSEAEGKGTLKRSSDERTRSTSTKSAELASETKPNSRNIKFDAKPSRGDKKEQTRRLLIDAALKLSAERGFSAISLREVAVASGITPAGFYRHFRDMEELGLALLDEVGIILRRLLREARRRVLPGPGAVQLSVETFLEFIHDNGNLFRLLLGERQGSTGVFRKAIHSEMDRFIGDLGIDLERIYTESGRPLRDPNLAAEAIVAIVFTVGAEALDLPKHKYGGLSLRIIEEIKIILRGSLIASKVTSKVGSETASEIVTERN